MKDDKVINTTAARHEWNYQQAKSYKMLTFWRMIALLSTIIAVMTTCSAITTYQAPKYIPFMYEVHDDGTVAFKGIIKDQKVQVSEIQIRAFLVEFIEWTRSISNDNIVNKINRDKARYRVTQTGLNIMAEYIAKEQPFEKAAKGIRVDIRISVLERMAEKTWRVQWEEVVRQDGNTVEVKRASGTFTYVEGQANNDLEAEKNPLQIYISDFYIGEMRY